MSQHEPALRFCPEDSRDKGHFWSNVSLTIKGVEGVFMVAGWVEGSRSLRPDCPPGPYAHISTQPGAGLDIDGKCRLGTVRQQAKAVARGDLIHLTAGDILVLAGVEHTVTLTEGRPSLTAN